MPELADVREPSTLRLTRTVAAPRKRVFRAWTEAEELREWIAPDGFEVVSAQADARVGGDYRIGFRGLDRDVTYVVGTYIEVEHPRRLSFTWLYEGSSRAETTVTVEFNETTEGTEIVLTHEPFVTPDFLSLHQIGWTSGLEHLAALVRT